MADPLILYFFKLRNEVTGKWHKTRWRMTIEEARHRHGEGNYQTLEWSREVRERPHSLTGGAGHLYR